MSFQEFCATVRAALPSANEHRLKASYMTGLTAPDAIGIFERNPLLTDKIDNAAQVHAVINWEWPDCPPGEKNYILHLWSWTDWIGETVDTLTAAVQRKKAKYEREFANDLEGGQRVQIERQRQRRAVALRKQGRK